MFGFFTVKHAAIWFCAPSLISCWNVIAAGFTSNAWANSFSACDISTLMKPLSRSVKVSVISCSVKSVRSGHVADALQKRHCFSPGTAVKPSGPAKIRFDTWRMASIRSFISAMLSFQQSKWFKRGCKICSSISSISPNASKS
ncbi:hypothetical protein D3C85_1425830 [compost metagenome]